MSELEQEDPVEKDNFMDRTIISVMVASVLGMLIVGALMLSGCGSKPISREDEVRANQAIDHLNKLQFDIHRNSGKH